MVRSNALIYLANLLQKRRHECYWFEIDPNSILQEKPKLLYSTLPIKDFNTDWFDQMN